MNKLRCFPPSHLPSANALPRKGGGKMIGFAFPLPLREGANPLRMRKGFGGGVDA